MRGYLVLRLSYRQVMTEWSVVSEGILELVTRGEHRWGRRSEQRSGLVTALKPV